MKDQMIFDYADFAGDEGDLSVAYQDRDLQIALLNHKSRNAAPLIKAIHADCQECGEDISERQKVVASATHCVSCMTMLNRLHANRRVAA